MTLDLIWVEVLWRYDWISHREDKQWNRFSRNKKLPIAKDELCRYWKIYKVRAIDDYTYKVLSERDE